MRALVKFASGPDNLEVRDIPVPEIGDEDVLLKVTYCGICGSDLHMQTGVHTCEPPVVLGHEYTGVVAGKGSRVDKFEQGDVVSYLTGFMPFPGVGSNGGFAEYMRVPAKTLWMTPEGVSPAEATQFETACVPMKIVRDRIRLQPGERVVVSGPGTVGLLTTNMARIAGAGHITVIGGPGDEKARLPKALELGADEALVFGDEALEKVISDGQPSAWMECSGAAPAVKAAVDCIGRNGRITVSGLGDGPFEVDMAKVSYENINIMGTWGGDENYIPESAELMRDGKLKVSAIITDIMPLTRWQEAFAKLRAGEGIKILLDPSK